MNGFTRAIAAAAIVGLAPAGAMALDSAPRLSLDVAKRMIDACEAMSTEKGWRMNIAVMDSGANLLAFRRMDGAFLGSVDIAIGKAHTSARFPFPTRMVANIAYGEDGKGGPLPGIAEVDGIIAFAGGLPIMGGGAHVGSIGVSGGTADEDEQCAAGGDRRGGRRSEVGVANSARGFFAHRKNGGGRLVVDRRPRRAQNYVIHPQLFRKFMRNEWRTGRNRFCGGRSIVRRHVESS